MLHRPQAIQEFRDFRYRGLSGTHTSLHTPSSVVEKTGIIKPASWFSPGPGCRLCNSLRKASVNEGFADSGHTASLILSGCGSYRRCGTSSPSSTTLLWQTWRFVRARRTRMFSACFSFAGPIGRIPLRPLDSLGHPRIESYPGLLRPGFAHSAGMIPVTTGVPRAAPVRDPGYVRSRASDEIRAKPHTESEKKVVPPRDRRYTRWPTTSSKVRWKQDNNTGKTQRYRQVTCPSDV